MNRRDFIATGMGAALTAKLAAGQGTLGGVGDAAGSAFPQLALNHYRLGVNYCRVFVNE